VSAQCFIDLFDSAAFRGERRRIFGPVRLDANMLGLDRAADVSLRVGSRAALRIEMTCGDNKTLHGGEQVDTLNTGSIKSLEVRPQDE
jgi:hypothetical protein